MQIAAIVLAAGLSSRMGSNKLIEEIEGEPMVRLVVQAVLASRARPVFVVVGHDRENIVSALDGLDVQIVENPAYGEGLGTSISTGVVTVPDSCAGALIILGDMPGISPGLIDRLIEHFESAGRDAICVATHGGRRGHPVLFASRYFSELTSSSGDVGARRILAAHADSLVDIEAGDDAPLADIDTQAALADWRHRRA